MKRILSLIFIIFAIILLFPFRSAKADFCGGVGVTQTSTYDCTSGGTPYNEGLLNCCTLGNWFCTNQALVTPCSSFATFAQCEAQDPTPSGNGCLYGMEGPEDIPITCVGCGWVVPASPTPTPGGGGGSPTPIPTPTLVPSSCTISLPNVPLIAGDPAQEVFADWSQIGGSIVSVAFTSSNTAVATVTTPDSSGPPWSTFVTPVSPGTSIFTATATMNTGTTCSNSVTPATITVQNPTGWWQVFDGDVTTNGSIQSPIPGACFTSPSCREFLVDNSTGNVPGVPLFGGNLILSQGIASQSPPWGWNANTSYSAITDYNYSFYGRLVPSDVEKNPVSNGTIGPGLLISQMPRTSPDGYRWAFVDGDVRLLRQDIDLNKIILFVDGDLTINGAIRLTPGLGFFMAIVSGDIIVEADINEVGPELEGIFVTDNNFITVADDDQLSIRGMVAAYGAVDPNRSLTNNSVTPAELFTYAPDLLFNYPSSLTLKRTRWKEVTP